MENAATVELGPTVDTYAAVSVQRVDYLEDYRGTPGVDSWDHGELRVDADVWAYPRGARLSAAYSFRRRAYDATRGFRSNGDGCNCMTSERTQAARTKSTNMNARAQLMLVPLLTAY